MVGRDGVSTFDASGVDPGGGGSGGVGGGLADAGSDSQSARDTAVTVPDVPAERVPPGALPLNALQVAGSHNSYHVAPLVALHASHKYSHKPLDQQLSGGLRAIELDVHLRDDGTFEVYHITVIDPRVTCSAFEDCLRLVATWSAAHPTHAPIFIWIELKDDTGGQTIGDPQLLEPVILRAFAREKLITPAWLRGSHASLRQRVMTAGWPKLDEARGKVMISLVNRDDRARAYSHEHTSLDDRLMFINATADQIGMPWAVVTEVNPEDAAGIAKAHAGRLMTVSNICAIDMSDEACQQRLGSALQNGVHMLKDDLPFAISGRNYVLKLPGTSPGCNPVTAPPGCAGPLE